MRRTALSCLLAVLVSAAGGALAQSTLRIGLAEDPDVLDPTLARTFVGRIVFAGLCDKLFDLDEKLNIVPQLATSYEWSTDNKALTIPLILFGSALIMKLMERFPIFITFGAGLLGWVAGEMAIADPAFKNAIDSHAHYMEFVAPVVGAAAVVIVGRVLARRAAAAEKETVIELPQGNAAGAKQEAA